ncbi:unnamed protein product [Arabis nemorensis]|uniref:Methyltransferase type 11 domain-containing protein n=1 Tax=Arabis nemorensis TaxID=586526 RepID=A0A565AZV6_9BRAS|nr:unnamed protein product [Arabis nemorensis]
MEDVKGKEIIDDAPTENKVSDEMENHKQPSSESEENAIKKKYGGLLPKKIPLISKDHERAFFDSADWALGKQKGQKPKGPLEALRPKLQPTPHQQPRARRMAYSSGENTEDSEIDNNESLNDQACASADDNTNLKGDGGSDGDMKDNIKPMFREHIIRRGRRYIRRLQSWFLNSTMQSYWHEIEDCKMKAFDKLTVKVEKVLEIGIGTGPNMKYYPARNINITVVGLDPNPKMKKYARKSAAKAGFKPKHFKFKPGVGEAIPLDDESVDAVVATLVLCSVSDVTQTLNEIKRVLRPGGTFIFLEHVAAKDGSFFRRLQKLLDPLQQRFADGCHLTRNTREWILEAGFSGGAEIETKSVYSFPWITRPHIYGAAYK